MGYFFHQQNHCVIGLNLPFLPQKIWNVPWHPDVLWRVSRLTPAFVCQNFHFRHFIPVVFKTKIHVGRCWSCSRAVSISTLDLLETHPPCLDVLLCFFFFNGLRSQGIKITIKTSTLGFHMFGSLFPSAFSYQIQACCTVAEVDMFVAMYGFILIFPSEGQGY